LASGKLRNGLGSGFASSSAWSGTGGATARQRGRPSNNRLAEERRGRIAELLKGKYEGFGPTLAAEKLRDVEGIAVSAETLRQMQIGLGLWRPKRRRAKRVFQLRERRARFGELIQITAACMTGSKAAVLVVR
jgi:hypothetical protein